MKSIFLVCSTLLFVAIFYSVNVEANNMTWGQPLQFDVLLHRSVEIKSSKFLQTVSRNFSFPAGTYHYNNRTITAIRLIDQVPKSTAYAQIYSGGVGFNHTTLHMKSERGKKLNYIVEIYGRGFH